MTDSPVATSNETSSLAASVTTPDSFAAQLRRVPPSFFSISMGLFGLAGLWRLSAAFFAMPSSIADAFAMLGAGVYALLLIAVAAKLAHSAKAVAAELSNPILGPFYALLPISGMLLCLQLQPHAPAISAAVGMIFVAFTILLGGWLTGQWIADGIDPEKMHPGYFLPTVAGGLIAADVSARFAHPQIGWLCFGIGMICWLVLGSIILTRLFFHSRLLPSLIPTLAIEVAPPAVAGNAYFTLTGGHVDTLAYVLAGYCVLMVLVQIRLIGVYRHVPFIASFWAFTFSYEAVAAVGLRWMHATPFPGDRFIGLSAVMALTAFVGWIALRSVFALQRGKFLPPAGPVATAAKAVPATAN